MSYEIQSCVSLVIKLKICWYTYVCVYTEAIMSLLHILLVKNLAVDILFIFVEISGHETTIIQN